MSPSGMAKTGTAASRAGVAEDYYRNRMAKTRAERDAAKKCDECGDNDPRPGLKSCQECADIKKATRGVLPRDAFTDLVRSVSRKHGVPVVAVLAADGAVSAARRELVAEMTARGLTCPEIADRLRITQQAVRQHRKNLSQARKAA